MNYSPQLVLLDRFNWERCLDIALDPEQERFTPPILFSIAQSKFDNLVPYGIMMGDEMVGFLMYGEFSGTCWINRVSIDREYQGMGVGRFAVRELIRKLRGNHRCREIRTSYVRENEPARQFFTSLGFSELPDALDSEVVAVFQG